MSTAVSLEPGVLSTSQEKTVISLIIKEKESITINLKEGLKLGDSLDDTRQVFKAKQ